MKMAKGQMGKNAEQLSAVIGVGMQKKQRPQIDTIINHLIIDPMIKQELNKIVSLLNENNSKPSWFTTSHYKFKHNDEISFQIKLGDGFKFREDEVYIKIHTTSPANLLKFKQTLSDDLRELVPTISSSDFRICNPCGSDAFCKNRADFEFEGMEYKNICAKNVTVDFLIVSDMENIVKKFKVIDKLIRAKIKYNNETM